MPEVRIRMTSLRHVFERKFLCVETIDVFHTLKFYAVCSARIIRSGSVDVYSIEFSEHGTVRRSMNGPSVRDVCVELDASAQNCDEDAGE